MTMLETKTALEDALYNGNPLSYDAMLNCYVAIQNFLAKGGDGNIKSGYVEPIEVSEIKVDVQCCSCGIPMGSQDNFCPNCGKIILKDDFKRRFLND